MTTQFQPGRRVTYGKRIGTVVKTEIERNGSLDCLVKWDEPNRPLSWVGANQLTLVEFVKDQPTHQPHPGSSIPTWWNK